MSYSLDSGGRLHTYKAIKQLCSEEYLSTIHCRRHSTSTSNGDRSLQNPNDSLPPPDLQIQFHNGVPRTRRPKIIVFFCLLILYFTPLSPIDKSKYILCATNHSGLIGKKICTAKLDSYFGWQLHLSPVAFDVGPRLIPEFSTASYGAIQPTHMDNWVCYKGWEVCLDVR